MHQYEREILRRRREHLILRVDRADLSKNVLRGFTAFDLFLEQHPEFKEQVTFIAHLIPSRQDVPEYAEYLERIEALAAVVNHRHGTTDWMPIDLRLRENLEEAIAAYKHYDLLMVNAMFDGMNLIAKEGPLVNERNGVSLLSENTGAHEELADFALSVNPFDVQEQADAIYRALSMSAEERSWRAQGLKRIVTARDPGDWVDDQLADIESKRRGEAPVAVVGPGRCPNRSRPRRRLQPYSAQRRPRRSGANSPAAWRGAGRRRAGLRWPDRASGGAGAGGDLRPWPRRRSGTSFSRPLRRARRRACARRPARAATRALGRPRPAPPRLRRTRCRRGASRRRGAPPRAPRIPFLRPRSAGRRRAGRPAAPRCPIAPGAGAPRPARPPPAHGRQAPHGPHSPRHKRPRTGSSADPLLTCPAPWQASTTSCC